MDERKMPETLEECMKGVKLCIEGREEEIRLEINGTKFGQIVGLGILAYQLSKTRGIPLEDLAAAIIASPVLMEGRPVTAVDLSKLPPDMADRLRES